MHILPARHAIGQYEAFHLLLAYLAAKGLLFVETETTASAPFWLYARHRNTLRVLGTPEAWQCQPGDEAAWQKTYEDFLATYKKGDWDMTPIIARVAKNYVRHLNDIDEAIAFVIAHPPYEWALWRLRNHALAYRLDRALAEEHKLRKQLKAVPANQPLRKLRLKLALTRAARQVAWCKVRATADLRAAALKLAKTEKLVT